MSTRQKHRLARYYALISRIEEALSSGTFYQWSIKKRKKLLERLKRYYRQCQHLLSGEKGKEASKWAFMVLLGAGLTVLSPQELVAQQFEPFNYGLTNVGNDSSPELVDIDGDGDLDAFVGEYYGNIIFQRNIAPLRPSRPIPTLGQWGVIILGFLTSILGVVGLRRRKGKEVEG